MNNNQNKTFWHQRIGKMFIAGVMAIIAAILAPVSAKAGILDSLTQFNNKVFSKLSTISGDLAKDISNYTNFTGTEIQNFLGVRNLVDPEAMSKSIVDSQNAIGNPIAGTPKAEVSRALNKIIASQILSKENQQLFADEQKLNQETSEDIQAATANSSRIADESGGLESSQKILTGISKQMSDVMKAQAAMVEMNAKQATANQVIQTGLAASAQNDADNTESRLGQEQAQQLSKIKKDKGQNESYIDNMKSQ